MWDVDGNEYYDFHNGFGSMAVGHAHPLVAEAVDETTRNGMHFAVTVEKTVALAEELCRRFNCDQVRFTNSGTESNMSAIRVARSATGRDVIAKIEGSYHGHVDQLMYSVLPGRRRHGRPGRPRGHAQVQGRAQGAWPTGSASCPSTTPPALERLFQAEGDKIACADHGAGDDEHRHRGAPARLPGGRP